MKHSTGIEEGYWVYYHYYGNIACRGVFINKVLLGYWEFYHTNQKLYSQDIYI